MNDKTSSLNNIPNHLTHELDQWRQANPKATLTEIEEAVEAKLAVMRKELVERMAGAETELSQKKPTCPQCSQDMVKNGRKKRRLRAKEGQTLELEREQWRCLHCGTTLFPPG